MLCFNAETTKAEKTLPRHFGDGELHMAFESREGEYQEWKNLLESEGIAIEHEQAWGEGRKSLYFRDPDNHCIEIVEPGIWD